MDTEAITYHPFHAALQPYLHGILYSRLKKNNHGLPIHLYPTGYGILCFDRQQKHFTDPRNDHPYNYTACYLGVTDFGRSFSDCTEEVFQVIFKPFGVYSIFGIPQQELANCITDGEVVFPGLASIKAKLEYGATPAACLAQIEQWLLQNLFCQQNRAAPMLADACCRIHQSQARISVTQLSREIGMSERNLRNYFQEQVGVGPKTLSRIIRFNLIDRVLEKNQYRDWQDIAFRFGFFDQTHFIKEFKWFYNTTPSRLKHLQAVNLSGAIATQILE